VSGDLKRLPGVAAIVLMASLSTLVADDHWPMFRGRRAGVAADDPALPVRWSADANTRWKFEIPGFAWSSPIVWGDYVFVTSVLSDEPRPTPDVDPNAVAQPHTGGTVGQKPLQTPYRWMLYALDFQTGRLKWERELRRGIPINTKHSKNTYASETPVTDGERVYVFHASAGLFAVDFKGRIVWSHEVKLPESAGDLPTQASPTLTGGGPPRNVAAGTFVGIGQAASPALYRDRLFISADHESRQWFFAAYSTRTGDELWRVAETKPLEAYGWSTPFVWESGTRTEIVTAGNNGVRSYDLDGKLLWKLTGMSINTTPTPFTAHGLLYVSSGYAGDAFRPVYAIRPGATGDISLKPEQTSNDYVVWSHRAGASYMPSALVYGDYYYTLYSQGYLTCHDARTGRQVYGRQRIATDSGAFTASPWAYNGMIFAASEDGDVFVIRAGPEFSVVGKNPVGEMILATPAIVRDSVVLRTLSSVRRIVNKTH
jgi:outer membrane protein assembly factor BamB